MALALLPPGHSPPIPHPAAPQVLVEKITAPTKSVGGVLLPDSAVNKVRGAGAGREVCWGCAEDSVV